MDRTAVRQLEETVHRHIVRRIGVRLICRKDVRCEEVLRGAAQLGLFQFRQHMLSNFFNFTGQDTVFSADLAFFNMIIDKLHHAARGHRLLADMAVPFFNQTE
jgi:hypothetical protein